MLVLIVVTNGPVIVPWLQPSVCQEFDLGETAMRRWVHQVAKSCDLLDVPRSAFYAWQQHTPSARELGDADLTEP